MKNFDYISPLSEALKSFSAHTAAVMESVSAASAVLPVANQMNLPMAEIAKSISIQPTTGFLSERLAATLQSAVTTPFAINDALMATMKNSMLSVSNMIQETLKCTSLIDYSSSMQAAAQQLLSMNIPSISTDIVASSLRGIIDSRISDKLLWDNIDDISDKNEISVISSELNETVSDSKNWQQKLAAFIQKHKERYPVLVGALISVLVFVLNYLATCALDMVRETVKPADVRQEPNTTSVLVAHVEVSSEVLVIDERPYYYLIKFIDPETDEEYQGWISKRSVVHKSDDGNEDESE